MAQGNHISPISHWLALVPSSRAQQYVLNNYLDQVVSLVFEPLVSRHTLLLGNNPGNLNEMARKKARMTEISMK